MSYKVLARKWRPQHFRDMLGQEPVLRALVNALDSNRLHHAYLFTGMRGVGKTSIARIFAKCLNCETKGVSSDPCGTCSACQDIDAGRFFDLIEVDAASRTKVEGTRELLENVPYAPASGRFKVYLIDEVHMFSTHSFNALLKTLEEPPEHVKFLLATTDPQKVPATVLSRCLQFNLRRIPPGMLAGYLSTLLSKEGIEHELPALDLIARASEGSVRDSLSLVEQAVAGGEGVVRAVDVESMLGRVSIDRLLSLIETLAGGDMSMLFAQVEELAQYAPEFSELLGELLSLLHRIALLSTVPESVDDSVPGYDRLVALAASLQSDEVQLFYQIGLHARRDMPFAPDTREAFDMALLRMHTFRPQQITGGPAAVDGQMPMQGSAVTNPRAKALSRVGLPTPDDNLPDGEHPKNSSATAKAPIVAGAADAEPEKAVQAVQAKKATGLQVRGSVSAGGSMRAAALAAARGEPLPEDIAQQVAAINAQHLPSSSKPEVSTLTSDEPGLAEASPAEPSPPKAGDAKASPANASSATAGPATAGPAAAGPAAAGPADPGLIEPEAERKGRTLTTASPDCTASRSTTTASERPEAASAEQAAVTTKSWPGTSAADHAEVSSPVQADDSSWKPSDNSPDQRPETTSARQSHVTAAQWPDLVRELDIAGMTLQLASHCALWAFDNNAITLQLQESSEHLHKPQFAERLNKALNDWFQGEIRLSIEHVPHKLETPASLAEKRAADELAAAHESIKLDPIVLQLIDKVDGALDEASIKPLDS